MQDLDTAPKRRPDGSIDAEHYIARGLDARAQALRGRRAAHANRGVLAALGTYLRAAFPFRAGGA